MCAKAAGVLELFHHEAHILTEGLSHEHLLLHSQWHRLPRLPLLIAYLPCGNTTAIIVILGKYFMYFSCLHAA